LPLCEAGSVEIGELALVAELTIPYAFDSLAHSEPLIGAVTAREQALADKVSPAWTNFAKTGNPSNKLMGTWKPYNAKERPIMVIDNEPKLVNDPLHDSRVIIAEPREKYQTVR
jgi:para-nitrobenzyl esterase